VLTDRSGEYADHGTDRAGKNRPSSLDLIEDHVAANEHGNGKSDADSDTENGIDDLAHQASDR